MDLDKVSTENGIDIPVPHVRIDKRHPCSGCIWYVRDASVLFCPFHECVRYKRGFEIPKRKEEVNHD